MRAAFALAPLLCQLACFGATELVLPSAPEDARSVFLFRECGGALSATAHRVEDAILPAVESCSSPLRYFALYSDETLETLNVGSGPVALGPCPDALEPCCVAAPLPTQSTETLYFADVGASEQGQRFQPIGPEGPFLSAENYQRDCQCPAMKSRAFILGDGSGQRSYAAVNGAGRVVLAMYRAEDETGACEETGTCGVLYESEIYATTPEELQREGPPRVPYVRLARSGVGSVALSEDGIVYLGFIDRSEVLFGPLGGELETLPISIEGDSSHLVALNPASAGAPEFAVASEAGPDAIRVYREGEWQALATNARDGATCAPNDDQQRSGLIFTPRGDLLFMPHGVGYRVRTEITPETAPDGLFRFRGNTAEWIRPPHAPDDCIRELGFVEELGILVATRSGQVHRESPEGWVDPAPLARAGFAQLSRDRDAFASFPGGYAYGGKAGAFGYAVDGVLCHEAFLGTNRIEDLTWVGDMLLATGSRSMSGMLTIYLIEFADLERD